METEPRLSVTMYGPFHFGISFFDPDPPAMFLFRSLHFTRSPTAKDFPILPRCSSFMSDICFLLRSLLPPSFS